MTTVAGPIVTVEAYWAMGHWWLRFVRKWDRLGASQAGRLLGTAAAICEGLGNGAWVEQDGFGVLLDRLQEAPEEVQGLDTETVLAGVEWLRQQG